MVVGGDGDGNGHGKLLFLFAGTTFDFSWNQFLICYNRGKIVLGDNGGDRHDFCYTGFLLETTFWLAAISEDGAGAATAATPRFFFLD